MKNIKRWLALLLDAVVLAIVGLTAAACSNGGGTTGGDSGNAITNQQQANDDRQYAFVQPIPNFPFSQIRQTVIEAEAIDALGVATTTFFFIPGVDHPIYSCASIGVPVPATDQLSNPSVAQWNVQNSNDSSANGVAGVTVGQQEPDGVFTGDTSGTNSLCVGGGGSQFLGYDEAYTVSFTAQAHWDKTTDTISVDGQEKLPVCHVVVINAKKKQAEEVCKKAA